MMSPRACSSVLRRASLLLLAGWTAVAGGADSFRLEVQRGPSALGPWSKVAEVQVPASQDKEFYRVSIGAAAGAAVPSQYTWIPAGTFLFGTPDTEVGRRSAEGPQTLVKISQGFWMSRFELTQREWLEVMGSNPSSVADDPELPVDNVSWEEAVEYCAKLTQRERAAGRLVAGLVYRLPTEAEWEYACRAGTTNATSFGDSLSSTNANYDGTFPLGDAAPGPAVGRTMRGGNYPPNAWGLYDMHGNVWEWCGDWHPSKLPGGRVTDPFGQGLARLRALRGGAWHNEGGYCRSGFRYLIGPIFRSVSSGLRPIIAAEI